LGELLTILCRAVACLGFKPEAHATGAEIITDADAAEQILAVSNAVEAGDVVTRQPFRAKALRTMMRVVLGRGRSGK